MKVRIIKEACGDMEHPPMDHHDYDHGEGKMARGQLYNIIQYATELMQMFDDNEDLPEWVEAKITKAFTYLDDAAHYLEADNAREQGLFDINQLRAMVMEEIEEMRKKKVKNQKRRRRKPVLSQVKNLPFVIGLVAKVQKVKKVAGLIATPLMGRADINPVGERPARKERNTLHVVQPRVLVRKKARENLGARKQRKEKSHETNN